ncbi:hypothetical protein ONZ45_g14870 [Pleurotus djamor]|nr:hypothetical protein ONZ45_g14870 [Pleurotus djamor]
MLLDNVPHAPPPYAEQEGQSEYKNVVDYVVTHPRALRAMGWDYLELPNSFPLRDIEGIKKFTSQKFSFTAPCIDHQLLRNRDRDYTEPFILNYLMKVGERLKDQLLNDFENIPKQLDNPWNLDATPLDPYNHACELADLLKASGFLDIGGELNLIVRHVGHDRGDCSNASDFEPRASSHSQKKGKEKAIHIPKRLETFTKAYAENLPQTRFLDAPRVAVSIPGYCPQHPSI